MNSCCSKNRGLIFNSLDSINLGIYVLLLFIPINSFIETLFGDSALSIVLQTMTRIVYFITIINALPILLKVLNFSYNRYGISFFLLILIISALLCPDSELIFQVCRAIFLFCGPYYFFSQCVTDYDSFYETLKTVAFIFIIICFTQIIIFPFTSTIKYSQDIGYYSLFPFIVFLTNIYSERSFRTKTISICLTIISLFFVLSSGSRGPLLCCIIGAIFTHFLLSKSKNTKIVTVILILLSFVVYKFFLIEILSYILDIFEKLNMSTRVVEGLLLGDIVEDDARDILKEIAWNYANDHFFVGSGFFNDRLYIYNASLDNSLDTTAAFSGYCHNFFYEILMQFGMMSGIVILIYFAYINYKVITNSQLSFQLHFYIICLTIGLLPLLVSRSWLTFPYFYLFFGLISVLKNK